MQRSGGQEAEFYIVGWCVEGEVPEWIIRTATDTPFSEESFGFSADVNQTLRYCREKESTGAVSDDECELRGVLCGKRAIRDGFARHTVKGRAMDLDPSHGYLSSGDRASIVGVDDAARNREYRKGVDLCFGLLRLGIANYQHYSGQGGGQEPIRSFLPLGRNG